MATAQSCAMSFSLTKTVSGAEVVVSVGCPVPIHRNKVLESSVR